MLAAMIRVFPTGDLARAVWIDLLAPTAAEIDQVRAATGLRVPTEAEISEIESTSRLTFQDGAYCLGGYRYHRLCDALDYGDPTLAR